MATYQTPGVYIEEVELGAKPIAGVGTSVAGFVGVTDKGGAYQDKPTLVTSWGDFVLKFGYYTVDAPYMAPALFSFFLNGGTTAFIVKSADDSDGAIVGTDGGAGARTGLTALTDVDEVTMVMAPGVTTETVIKALIAHCELMKDRIAILDTPEDTITTTAIATYKEDAISADGYASLYAPWYKSAVEYIDTADNNKLKSQQIFIPPSGAMAGVYSRSDTGRGVHKAPANEQVRGALELKVNYNKAEQALLNPNGINCIRAFAGRGILVWGARTTASNSLWKYINVRRLFMFLEESIDEGTQWVVFEPNDAKLWDRVKQTIINFLTTQWREGALMGSTPEEAFFVKCDRETMTQDDIDNGRLICEIGVCPVKPAEFVIFRIAQQCNAGA
ncbi:phage tail sheath family protein [Sulfurovum sp. bin170]|uniref:phage tail sheath family protein n=1 Tax=Sulfurovum sp. bin170 TaxID=2695268 RepID=UPI0013DF7995|nr:phage tail sheath family protein [Sulfurovum sp. bin170]NEW60824.1 phage tail sheath family protein [Sulfurovum sp. bin170]